MNRQQPSDLSRRDMLRVAGHGAVAAGLLSPLAAMAAPVNGQLGPGNPSPDKPQEPGQAQPAPAGVKASGQAGQGGEGGKKPDWNTPLAPPDKQPPDIKLPEAPKKQAGYAIVGLGELALTEILPAFQVAKQSRPVALVSGHPDKAKQVANAYGIAEKNLYTYQNFDQIKDNPEIDVVYVVLPNSMHAEYTVRGFKAGKHVLCEKPMATSVAECEQMIVAGREAGRKLMIAYRLHYEPYNQSMIAMARSQEFGPLRVFESSNVQNIQAPNIRLSEALGGGALMDIGVYCLNAARYISGEEPIEVSGWVQSDLTDPRFREVDETIVFNLRFPSGVLAACSASHGGGQGRRYRAYCADGWMELDPAFDYRGLRMRTARKQGQDGQNITEIRLREVNQFASEMDHFSACIAEGREPWTPGEEGLKDIRVVMKIFEAVHGGGTVKV